MFHRRSAVAIVHHPSEALYGEAKRMTSNPNSGIRLGHKDRVIIKLRRDDNKTYNLTPDEWRELPGCKIESIEGKTPPVVYYTPAELVGEKAVFLLKASEFGQTDVGANIIAGPKGEPLRRSHTHRYPVKSDWHCASFFYAQALSAISWKQGSTLTGAQLEIRQEAIALEDGRLVKRANQVLPPYRLKASDPFSLWPVNLEARWRPAVQALIRLLYCQGCSRPHYAAG